MAIHEVKATRKNLRGSYSTDFPPILTIDSGDTVRFQTLDARWTLTPSGEQFSPQNPDTDKGHALCGPVAIRGAQPGNVLEVQINRLIPGSFGWTVAGGFPSPVNQRLGLVDKEHAVKLDWTLDRVRMTAKNQFGHEVVMRPFMGIMGLSPGAPGVHSTIPPRSVGGNIDCKELVAGSTLYLPVEAPDALFYTGDGHAAQGDGEISVTAIECGMDVVDLTFHLRTDLNLTMPLAKTPTAYITFGFSEDLDEATFIAMEGMLTLLGQLYGFNRSQALAMSSVTVDLHVTQMVNGLRGVHAMLPFGAIRV